MADEFDLIDGDLAELDVDWERVLGSAGPLGTTTGGSRQSTDVHQPISPGARSNATSSFGFGDDDIDASFLAELDRVEQDVVARSNNAGDSHQQLRSVNSLTHITLQAVRCVLLMDHNLLQVSK